VRLVWSAVGVCWAVAACAVIAFSLLPRLAGYQVLIVRSGSMEPAIHTGSTVVVQPVRPDALKVGDVITFERSEGAQTVVTHRIVEVLNPGPPPTFRTKGDANNIEDPFTVTFRDTGWKVIAAVPLMGYFYNALAHPVARLLLIGVPVVYLSAVFMRDIWRGGR
jgi:signal peptidase I